jgi:hypothetical protein
MGWRLSGLWTVFYPLPCDKEFGSVAVNSTRYLPPELLQLLTPDF